jgi:hypothetical protein
MPLLALASRRCLASPLLFVPLIPTHRIYNSDSFHKPHKYATYGIMPSTAPSSDDEDDDTLPRSALSAPIEALQGLANAAAEAAAVPSASPPRLVPTPVTSFSPNLTRPHPLFRVRKRKKPEPTPRNAFPHAVEKVGSSSICVYQTLIHTRLGSCL